MTRETKIGLLVGLAFIIVIGVLLSDHLTNATNPQMSNQMVGFGTKVSDSLGSPGGANPNKNVRITPTGDVLPPEQVPTRVETLPRPVDPNAHIEISPVPPSGPVQIIAVAPRTTPSDVPAARLADGSAAGTLAPPPVISAVPDVRPLPRLDTVAPLPAEKRQHKAQAGDTVSKLAYKYYGKNTKELRDLITKANPSLQRSPDKIVVGQLYVIPPSPSTASHDLVASSTVSRAMMATATTQPALAAPTAAAGVKTYTVKANDSIWRIATEQCHDANAAKQILALNKDVLKGTDKLQVGMKLKLPEKKTL